MLRTNWPKRAKHALSTSGKHLEAIRAQSSLFLLPLLTACGNTQTVYVPAPVLPISADLTADTPIPGMAVPFTWQASLELNAKLYTALGKCNLDKSGIRSIEARRSTLDLSDK
ncbi:Rz1-like lysis system protein LysC [Kosakonia sp. 1610]|uniref:Rz1-like lysis system protein LysC n=1 Tax=Kosakonia sp. 1610 TaxID=3156426 RepID=UPI003D263581